jgi:uncharacterized protein (DUF697 family)/tellurite resistance protein
MTPEQTHSILSIALLAAFADHSKDDREREAIKRVAEALGKDSSLDLPGLYRQVLLEKPSLAELAGKLPERELRQLAYEMAVGVIEADGSTSAAESTFLADLAQAFELPRAQAETFNRQADAIAAPAAAVEGVVLGSSSLPQAEMDKLITHAAITNAALELLPESLASMAIIPLQLRLVYRIGKSYGYEMDASHARDFIATLGAGLTSQYVEQFGRKLLGGLLGGIGGGVGRAVGRQAASSGLSFATTYAIGRIAQRYYSGGRNMDAATLKTAFADLLGEARGLAPNYAGEIMRKAETIDLRNLSALIRQA